MDDVDFKIILLLQENARISNAEIARQVEMTPSAILRRIRNLEARGVIQGYEVRIDPEAIGLPILAYALIKIDPSLRTAHLSEILEQMKGVEEVHYITGEDCLLIKIRAVDLKSLSESLRGHLVALMVRRVSVKIVLNTIKETSRLAIKARHEL